MAKMESQKRIALVAHDSRKPAPVGENTGLEIACNSATADFILKSSLLDRPYRPAGDGPFAHQHAGP